MYRELLNWGSNTKCICTYHLPQKQSAHPKKIVFSQHTVAIKAIDRFTDDFALVLLNKCRKLRPCFELKLTINCFHVLLPSLLFNSNSLRIKYWITICRNSYRLRQIESRPPQSSRIYIVLRNPMEQFFGPLYGSHTITANLFAILCGNNAFQSLNSLFPIISANAFPARLEQRSA